MQRIIALLSVLVLVSTLLWSQSTYVQFVFTSDSHYGITRPAFRGMTNVDAHVVNSAMVAAINRLPASAFPADGGLRTAQPVGAIDFLADAGDIANREENTGESTIQTAAASWSQFQLDYINGLSLLDGMGRKAAVYVVPGNHDASNTVGFYRPMVPITDRTSMVGIYNLMMSPPIPKTVSTYDYNQDKVLTARDIGGIRFLFITIWPDSRTRTRMEDDLARINPTTPVIIFAHDPPDSDSKHFINPNGRHDVNDTDRFENLLSDTFASNLDGVQNVDVPPLAEQKAWEGFLRRHPNITAYFHGHSNWNQFYDWTGPNHSVTLHTFRVDSPMKGHFSASDETKLSFQFVTIDTAARTMTVREVLWNAEPNHPDAPLTWGASTTVALAPRPVLSN